MALVLKDRVQETATANTTVSFTLTGAVTGFQPFTIIGNGNTTFYSATDATGNWEVGVGTYATSGPTLTRTTILSSSNSGSAVTFSGTVNVFVTYPSEQSVNLDASNNVSALGTVSSGIWQGTTIGVAYGGTGVTSSSGANSVVLRDANSNISVNRLNQANTNTTAAGGVTALTAASGYVQTLVGTGGQTFTLPDATTVTTGATFLFNNLATGTITIENYAAAVIKTVPSGGAGAVFLTDNSTVAGTWDVHAYLPEGVTFGTNAFDLGTAIVSGGTWQGGTVQSGYGGTGLTSFVAGNNALYSTSSSALTAGTLPIAAGGTGETTRQNAIDALVGATTSGYYLRGNGTDVVMAALAAGDMTGTLAVTNGGTGATSLTGYGALVMNAGGTAATTVAPGATGNILTSNGTSWASTAPAGGGVTTFSAGTTGLTPSTATSGAVTLSGTLGFTNGGTSATTRQAAINALAGAVTNAQYLRGNGTNITMSGIQASDVPTLNQNTTGSSGSCTGNAATATTATNATNTLASSGQTYQNVTGSRSLATDYTNSTGRPIFVSINFNNAGNQNVTLLVGGQTAMISLQDLYPRAVLSGCVPPGLTYRANRNTGGGNINGWFELRT
jgi:hypothetical protein